MFLINKVLRSLSAVILTNHRHLYSHVCGRGLSVLLYSVMQHKHQFEVLVFVMCHMFVYQLPVGGCHMIGKLWVVACNWKIPRMRKGCGKNVDCPVNKLFSLVILLDFWAAVVSVDHLDNLHPFMHVPWMEVYIEHLCSQHQGCVSQRQPSPVQLCLAAGWTVPRSPAAGWSGSYIKKKKKVIPHNHSLLEGK